MAVALPQPDAQDRLRVLASAVSVAQPIAPESAKKFAREGAHLEAELIAGGEQPAVSIFGSGSVDCASAANFVESLPASAAARAQDSLLGPLSARPRQTLEPAKIKLQTALAAGLVAARPLMAVMEPVGAQSQWSRQQFVTMFASLPEAAESERAARRPTELPREIPAIARWRHATSTWRWPRWRESGRIARRREMRRRWWKKEAKPRRTWAQ